MNAIENIFRSISSIKVSFIIYIKFLQFQDVFIIKKFYLSMKHIIQILKKATEYKWIFFRIPINSKDIQPLITTYKIYTGSSKKAQTVPNFYPESIHPSWNQFGILQKLRIRKHITKDTPEVWFLRAAVVASALSHHCPRLAQPTTILIKPGPNSLPIRVHNARMVMHDKNGWIDPFKVRQYPSMRL